MMAHFEQTQTVAAVAGLIPDALEPYVIKKNHYQKDREERSCECPIKRRSTNHYYLHLLQ